MDAARHRAYTGVQSTNSTILDENGLHHMYCSSHCRIRTREQLIIEHEDEAEVIRDRNYHQTERVELYYALLHGT